VRPLGLEPRTH